MSPAEHRQCTHPKKFSADCTATAPRTLRSAPGAHTRRCCQLLRNARTPIGAGRGAVPLAQPSSPTHSIDERNSNG